MKKLNIAIGLGLLLGGPLVAQQELMLHQSDDLWHQNSVNPASFPENKRLAIGLPALTLDAAHSGDIAYNDLIREEGDETVFDFGQAIDKLEPENKVFFDQRLETVNIGFRLPVGGWMLTAGHAYRLHGVMTYPKTLPELIWRGNGPYIGQTLDIAPEARIFDWNEWSVGVAQKFLMVTAGVRLKYLTGVSALETDESRHQATIHTDPDIYQLTINTDYALRSSSIISSIDTSGVGFDLNLYEFNRKAFSKNGGFAVDLGLIVELSEQLTLNASVLDLGGTIKWKENAGYFRSNGNFTYSGLDFPGADIITGEDSLSFENALDTLNDVFRFNRTEEEFSTRLPLRYYVGGTYKLTDRWVFGAALFGQTSRDRTTTAVGVSADFRPVKWLSVGTMYSLNDRTAANVGFKLVVKPGPVQIYALSDNLINAFNPKAKAAANLRLGLSVVL
jgi:hypothetical protein